jgi:chromosome segregation ATPase
MRIKNIISVNLDEKINTIEEDLKDINSDIVQIIKALQSAEERINNLEFSFEEFGANVKKIIDDIYNSSLTINDLKSLNSKINSIDMRLSEIPKLVIK